MRPTDKGLQPESGFLESRLEQMPELQSGSMPQYEIIEYSPVIDSANMAPENWMKMARDISANYSRFDGFVILHGTDTMAYTSSVLPFMMPGLGKPVVLTGSQLPLGHFRNDARENLKTAMLFAANTGVPEVCIFFGEVLLRGCRATKISATRLDAFESPNYPALGTAETSLEVFANRLRPAPTPSDSVKIESIRSSEIATFRLFPGMSPEVLQNVLQRPLKALILESYGVGNGPSANRRFLSAIESAHKDGIVLVNCTQCRHGCVSQSEYEVGRSLADAGVVSGRDMTIEATIAKLLYLFSRDLPADKVRSMFGESLVGELTPEQPGSESHDGIPDASDGYSVTIRGTAT